jgi:hypothetical protein
MKQNKCNRRHLFCFSYTIVLSCFGDWAQGYCYKIFICMCHFMNICLLTDTIYSTSHFVCEIEAQKKLPYTDLAIGIDMGLKHFMTDSNRDVVDNPRFFRKSHGRLKKKQQRLSKRQNAPVSPSMKSIQRRPAKYAAPVIRKVSTRTSVYGRMSVCIVGLCWTAIITRR